MARRFLRKFFLFALPLVLAYPVLIFVVDPFDFLDSPSPISDEAKLRTAAKLNPFFWKMNQFEKRPVANILLGDSPILSLRAEKIAEMTGEQYFNFAYGGGTIQEAIDTFWFANQFIKLSKVYIGINLIHYNDAAYERRTASVSKIQQHPANYFFDRIVLQSTIYALYSGLTHSDPKIGVPRVTRETGWRETLVGNGRVFRDFKYPARYRDQLMQIARYCHEHQIELFFIILPTHVDLQRLAIDWNLQPARLQIKQELATMGTVYDFDYENDLTRDANNFKDPVHFTEQVGDHLVSEIWGGRPQQTVR